jgi:predicted nucleic acid-binding protein
LYLEDPGYQEVRALAAPCTAVASAWHAQAELVSAFHRSFREGRLSAGAFHAVLEQFEADDAVGLFRWIPLTDAVQQRVRQVYAKADARVCLRAADALHLACAAEAGFSEGHSNDRHLRAAALLFGVRAR